MKALTVVVVLVLAGGVVLASPPRLKMADEVTADPTAATPLELYLASMDIFAASVRLSAQRGDMDGFRASVVGLRESCDMLLKWLDARPLGPGSPAAPTTTPQFHRGRQSL